MDYIITFFISLTAATVLPISSEATLLYYIDAGQNPLLLFILAGVGNVLGSLINYAIGGRGIEYLLEKNKISQTRWDKSKNSFKKYGAYSLLLSWVPIIGDPLTLVAGALRYDFYKFIILVSLAKFGRYAVLIGGYLYFD